MHYLVLCSSLVGLSVSCSHNYASSQTNNQKTSKFSESHDYSLGEESDLNSPIFAEGEKFRHGKTFELPPFVENDTSTKTARNK